MPAPTAHSKIVGGSTAARLLNCPGSAGLIATLPPQIDKTSAYAEEGSDLHTLLAAMIDSDGAVSPVPGVTTIGSTLITQELMHDCIDPCWAYWLELRGGAEEIAVEVQAAFPGITGAFGTCDLAARSDKTNTTWLTDWKFGVGHSVAALYPDPEDANFELVNEQLLFYACALRNEWPDWFPPDTRIVLTIVQPRSQDPDGRVTAAEVSNEDLDDFIEDVKRALKISAVSDAPMKIGPWCRFAPCKPACPLHNGPLMEVGDYTVASWEPGEARHGQMLAGILDRAELVEAILAEASKQAHAMLEAGLEVPGWKLVAKRPTRQWNQSDADTIKLLLKQFKLVKAKVTETVLKSPAQVEKVMPKGVKVPPELAGMVSSGTTLAPLSDKRPAALPSPQSDLKTLLELSLAEGAKPS